MHDFSVWYQAYVTKNQAYNNETYNSLQYSRWFKLLIGLILFIQNVTLW